MIKRKKLLFSIVLFIALSGMALFTFRNTTISHWLSSGPRKAKKQLETTYEIGWWAYQEKLDVTGFTVNVIDSHLNLANNKSLLSYTIDGTLKGSKNWKPYLEHIHLSERYVDFGSDTTKGIIEITPVIQVKENNSYNGEPIPFRITNELILESRGWGPNNLLFTCANHEKNIELMQRK